MDTTAQMLQQAYENLSLEEGFQCIEHFLIQAYRHPGASVKYLAQSLELPIPVASAMKNELKRGGLLQTSSGVSLTRKGLSYVNETLRYDGLDRAALNTVLDAPELPIDLFADAIKDLTSVFQNRPSVDVTVDQSHCTPETALKRALLMLRNSALIGRRLLFSGDDDLISLATLQVLNHFFPKKGANKAELVVFDVDERILAYIEAQARIIGGASVTCVCHDLRKPLPPAFRHYFDAAITDPPYTLEGLSLFLGRCVSALKPEPDLPLFLSFAHKSASMRLEIQRLLSASGLVAEQIYHRFNQYHGAQILGGVSDLRILNTTRETRCLLPELYDGPLYTNEFNRSVRLYQCRTCGAEYRVGHGEAIATVESLKSAGCAHCGGDVFSLNKVLKLEMQKK